MLDSAIKQQLQSYFQSLTETIDIVADLDDSEAARELDTLLQELASLTPLITVRAGNTGDERRPSFTIGRPGTEPGVRFAGVPMGHEFSSLVLALLQVGGMPPKVDEATAAQIRALQGNFRFEAYISLTCQNCPEVVQALNVMAVLNPAIRVTTIDGALFQSEVEARQIMAVPSVYLNGAPFGQGRMAVEEILAKLDAGSATRAAATISAKDPFDVLVVGGGPAGAAAAIYAARKGVRTGVIAERFGGQVLDTMGIENFISVKETEGPKLAAA